MLIEVMTFGSGCKVAPGVQGHSDREIGKLLGPTVRTVRFHLAKALDKAEATSRTHLAAVAISRRWISL